MRTHANCWLVWPPSLYPYVNILIALEHAQSQLRSLGADHRSFGVAEPGESVKQGQVVVSDLSRMTWFGKGLTGERMYVVRQHVGRRF